jgi:hypothetical protein
MEIAASRRFTPTASIYTLLGSLDNRIPGDTLRIIAGFLLDRLETEWVVTSEVEAEKIDKIEGGVQITGAGRSPITCCTKDPLPNLGAHSITVGFSPAVFGSEIGLDLTAYSPKTSHFSESGSSRLCTISLIRTEVGDNRLQIFANGERYIAVNKKLWEWGEETSISLNVDMDSKCLQVSVGGQIVTFAQAQCGHPLCGGTRAVLRLDIPENEMVFVNANPSHFCLARDACTVKLLTKRGQTMNECDTHFCDQSMHAVSSPPAWLPLACIAKQTLRQVLTSDVMQQAIQLKETMTATEDCNMSNSNIMSQTMSTVSQALDFVAFTATFEPAQDGGGDGSFASGGYAQIQAQDPYGQENQETQETRENMHPRSKKASEGDSACFSIVEQIMDDYEPLLYGACVPSHNLDVPLPTLQELFTELTGGIAKVIPEPSAADGPEGDRCECEAKMKAKAVVGQIIDECECEPSMFGSSSSLYPVDELDLPSLQDICDKLTSVTQLCRNFMQFVELNSTKEPLDLLY